MESNGFYLLILSYFWQHSHFGSRPTGTRWTRFCTSIRCTLLRIVLFGVRIVLLLLPNNRLWGINDMDHLSICNMRLSFPVFLFSSVRYFYRDIILDNYAFKTKVCFKKLWAKISKIFWGQNIKIWLERNSSLFLFCTILFKSCKQAYQWIQKVYLCYYPN